MRPRTLLLIALCAALGWFVLATTVGGFLIAIGAAERGTVVSTLLCLAMCGALAMGVMRLRRG